MLDVNCDVKFQQSIRLIQYFADYPSPVSMAYSLT